MQETSGSETLQCIIFKCIFNYVTGTYSNIKVNFLKSSKSIHTEWRSHGLAAVQAYENA